VVSASGICAWCSSLSVPFAVWRDNLQAHRKTNKTQHHKQKHLTAPHKYKAEFMRSAL
jgi:hypothetical protein